MTPNGSAAPAGLTHIAQIPQHWARETPEAPAVWQDDRPTSYAALQRHITAAAELLRQRGVVGGDRVMIVSENGVTQIALIFAAASLHAWPMVVNPRLSAREVDALRGLAAPRVTLCMVERSAEAAAHAARLGAVTLPGSLPETLALLADPDARAPEALPLAQQVGLLMATSGSTGMPKGVLVTHAGLLHFCRVSAEARRMHAGDVVYAVLPISHIFGMATQLLVTLYAGASLYLDARFTPEGLLAALARRRLSMLLGVPTLFVRLLAHLRERGAAPPPHALRYAYVGGAALELPLKREFEAVFGCAMHHGYGMTEYAGSMFITRVDRPRDDASAGELNEGCEVRLVDPHGCDVPQGEVGEIWIRGAGLMLGYYRAPELSAQAMREGGWFNTGDLGRLDAGGALFVCGRSKDMIIRSGFNVYPAEVEAVLNAHPAIHLAAVFGRPAADGNEDVVAAVELEPGQTLEPAAMRGWLEARLAPYKRPTRWIELAALPLLANGKVARHALLERLREGTV